MPGEKPHAQAKACVRLNALPRECFEGILCLISIPVRTATSFLCAQMARRQPSVPYGRRRHTTLTKIPHRTLRGKEREPTAPHCAAGEGRERGGVPRTSNTLVDVEVSCAGCFGKIGGTDAKTIGLGKRSLFEFDGPLTVVFSRSLRFHLHHVS